MTTVTIEVPAPEPVIRRPDGDPAGADALAETLYAVAGRFEEYGDRASSLQELNDDWWGQAYVAYREAAGKASGEHASMGATVKRVGHAVTAYADTLRDLLRVHDELRDRRAALDAQRGELIADIDATVDATPQQITVLRSRASYLAGRYETLVADHDSWRTQVQAAEDLLRRSFESATDLRDALSDLGGVSDTAQDAMAQPGAPGPGSTPERVSDWWQGLSDAEREAVVSAYPGVIGSADGLPAGARDDANRVLLDGDLAHLEAKDEDGTISADERRALDNARRTEEALATADSFTDPLTGERPGGQLWLYDPTAFGGDGRVAVTVGDLDTADDVAVFTPGITTDMRDVASYTTNMTNLYESTRYNGDGSSVAAMFWLGYDAPHGPTDTATLTEGRAEDGGRRLADAIDGLRASRGDDPAHLTAIGHSYGSTTTSYAAGDFDLAADDVVLIGSPGAGPADEAGDFSVGADHVYVGRDSRDLVATLGDEGWVGKGGVGLGTDPSSDDFGATRFEAERWTAGRRCGWGRHTRATSTMTPSLSTTSAASWTGTATRSTTQTTATTLGTPPRWTPSGTASRRPGSLDGPRQGDHGEAETDDALVDGDADGLGAGAGHRRVRRRRRRTREGDVRGHR